MYSYKTLSLDKVMFNRITKETSVEKQTKLSLSVAAIHDLKHNWNNLFKDFRNCKYIVWIIDTCGGLEIKVQVGATLKTTKKLS